LGLRVGKWWEKNGLKVVGDMNSFIFCYKA